MQGKGYQVLPCVMINSKKLKYNLETIQNLIAEKGPAHYATDVCAYEPLLKLMAESGIRNFADSRVDNLTKAKPRRFNLVNQNPEDF